MFSRFRIWIAAAICIAVIAWFYNSTDDGRPRFVPVTRPVKIPSSNWVSFPFLNTRLIQNDKMWVSTYGKYGTNFAMYLLDLQTRKVLGQLKRADPICFDETGTQLLCSQGQHRTWMTNKWARPIAALILWMSRGKDADVTDQPELIWLLNIRNNKATLLGSVNHTSHSRSGIYPSPDLKWAYARGTAIDENEHLVLCDLVKKSSRRVAFAPYPCDWWDDHTILAKTTNHEFVLYDVVTNGFRVLVGSDIIAPWLQHAPLARGTSAPGVTWPADVSPFAVWNGHENDFYVTDHLRRWGATNSFLLKMDRPSGKLTTLSTNFQFGWGDAFSPDGKYYVYSSTNSRKDNSGIFIRDLVNDTVRQLKAPDGGRAYSNPRFYRDGVIFASTNSVQFIKLNETNSVPLFP